MVTLETALHLGENTCGTILFNIAAAFPSVDREWVVPVDPGAAVYLDGTVFSEASLWVQRRIRQGCPASGSIWALLFGLVERRLVAALPSPQDFLTCFADDVAASSA